MARIPKRLAGPLQLTTTATTQYTVPSVTKTVIRHIHVSNPTTSPVTLTMSIGADAAGTRIFDAYSVAGSTVLDHFCYYVAEAAEVIQAKSGTVSTLVLTMDGDEIILG